MSATYADRWLDECWQELYYGDAEEADLMATDECTFCGQTIELAEDGAWQTVDAKACGCMEGLEQGGSGEHEPAGGAA